MSDWYLVAVPGCDDVTKVLMRFTTEELAAAKRIAEEITANGGGCRPTMKVMAVEPSTDQASEWDYDFEDLDTGIKYNTKENI